MEKIVVVSTNNCEDYYFYSPYIKKAWNSLGWKVCCMITHDVDPMVIDADYICVFPKVEGIRLETIAQSSRLYAAHFFTGSPDALLMTSDMDLLPLSDYWKPNPNTITNYGHDLTGHTFYPMGYTAMTVNKWIEVMKITHDIKADMLRDVEEIGLATSDKWENWWNHDWTLLTKRLKPYAQSGQLTSIERGKRKDSYFAYGRIDRGDSMQLIPPPWIDAHCENNNVKDPNKLKRFLYIFETVYGKL
jgi:hypothetical protein